MAIKEQNIAQNLEIYSLYSKLMSSESWHSETSGQLRPGLDGIRFDFREICH